MKRLAGNIHPIDSSRHFPLKKRYRITTPENAMDLRHVMSWLSSNGRHIENTMSTNQARTLEMDLATATADRLRQFLKDEKARGCEQCGTVELRLIEEATR